AVADATAAVLPQAAVAGSAGAAAARVATVAGNGGGGRGGSGGTADGLSVRIGGIGGTAGSRIASGSGNAEAAAAISEVLIDALLDELPEVRQAAARGVGRLLKLEARTRRKVEAAVMPPQEMETATVTATVTAPAAVLPRRSLSPLLTEQLVRVLTSAVQDKDGETRREVVGALGRLRLPRPSLLREVVLALRHCIAANPAAADWLAAAATAWRLGAAAPAAAAASVRDLAPLPQELTTAGALVAAPTAAGSSSSVRAALRQLSSDSVLRLLVLAGAYAVQPVMLEAALPPHISATTLMTVSGMYRP
ncbi:hypothetical protein Vafri_16671, partial [Volvox africanus]